MKRLLILLVVLSLCSYLAVQYFKDRRFNPPSDYDYPISEQIDKDFYDPIVLKTYYQTALEIGTYARALWHSEGIDVRFLEEENIASIEAVNYYNQLLVTAKQLENQLVKAKALKDEGFENFEIRLMMEQGLSPEDIMLRQQAHLLNLKMGDTGAPVWELQKLLNQQGDSIPEDGIFNRMTQRRLMEFQVKSELFASGTVDQNTLKALLK